MKTSKLLAVLLAIVTALTLLAFSIAAPILCRPFYYAHIGPMELCEQTGYTEEEIRTAYDEMMDFCLGGEEFSTGVLKWLEEGKSHFEDVRKLFLLDLKVLGVCAILLIALIGIVRISGRRPGRPAGRGFLFWAGAGLGAAFLLVGGLAATDFDRAFVIFHTLFFPGKTNWIFDPWKDEIINILPEAFFRNCAIAIVALIIGSCVVLIVKDVRRRKKQ
jgi:integral membrane protein (TIGR01906 family)